MNYTTNEVHISTITSGDTIKHDGVIMTVTQNNIQHCSFMGTSLFGDNYRSGRILVKKLIIHNGEVTKL